MKRKMRSSNPNIFHLMEVFMASNAMKMKVCMNGPEIINVKRRYPQVSIQKSAQTADKRFVCTVEKSN